MLRTRFVMLALSKASERLNRKFYLWQEHLTAGTLNAWAPLSNQNNRIILSIYSIKDTMEQLHFIITKITKNSSQQYDCVSLACQKICRTYIKEKYSKRTDNLR